MSGFQRPKYLYTVENSLPHRLSAHPVDRRLSIRSLRVSCGLQASAPDALLEGFLRLRAATGDVWWTSA
jgi:hypothetical protein